MDAYGSQQTDLPAVLPTYIIVAVSIAVAAAVTDSTTPSGWLDPATGTEWVGCSSILSRVRRSRSRQCECMFRDRDSCPTEYSAYALRFNSIVLLYRHDDVQRWRRRIGSSFKTSCTLNLEFSRGQVTSFGLLNYLEYILANGYPERA